jgi:hypothetical protein
VRDKILPHFQWVYFMVPLTRAEPFPWTPRLGDSPAMYPFHEILPINPKPLLMIKCLTSMMGLELMVYIYNFCNIHKFHCLLKLKYEQCHYRACHLWYQNYAAMACLAYK